MNIYSKNSKRRQNNDVYNIVKENESYFKELHDNSIGYLSVMVQGKRANGSQNEVALIENSISFMKEAFQIYSDRPEIIRQLLKIKFIFPLDISERGLYGKIFKYYEEQHGLHYGIYLNPNLSGNGLLTPYERTRLYFFHELGHIIHEMWKLDVEKEMQKLVNTKRLTSDAAMKFYDGFCMLDEACTQERAEEIAYTIAGKNRPSSRIISFGNYQVSTNFDFYGELQILSGQFAKTLRGIGKYDSDQFALSILSKRALSSNFAQNIIFEYTRDGHTDDLINLLTLMGALKEASYASFGMGKVDFNVDDVIETTVAVCDKLRDYRERNF